MRLIKVVGWFVDVSRIYESLQQFNNSKQLSIAPINQQQTGINRIVLSGRVIPEAISLGETAISDLTTWTTLQTKRPLRREYSGACTVFGKLIDTMLIFYFFQ